MKLISASLNSDTIKISKSDLEKKAQGTPDTIEIPEVPIQETQETQKSEVDKWYEGLNNLDLVVSDHNSSSDSESHHERSPGDPWGTREVYDGEHYDEVVSALLTGDLFLLPDIIDSPNQQSALKEALIEDIKDYGKEGVIETIQDEINEAHSEAGDAETEVSVHVDVKSMTPKGGNVFNVTFALTYAVEFFLSEHEIRSRAEDAKGDDDYKRF